MGPAVQWVGKGSVITLGIPSKDILAPSQNDPLAETGTGHMVASTREVSGSKQMEQLGRNDNQRILFQWQRDGEDIPNATQSYVPNAQGVLYRLPALALLALLRISPSSCTLQY